MTPVEQLIELDRTSPKRIAVIGDGMEDVFHTGRMEKCQDGCMKFVTAKTDYRPGGAANAARQLAHWNSEAFFIGLGKWPARCGVNCEYSLDEGFLPRKERFYEDGRIVFRHDVERQQYGLSDSRMCDFRDCALKAIEYGKFDAILMCDYDKGFLTKDFMAEIAARYAGGMPILIDAKRHPSNYCHCMLKVNEAWEQDGNWSANCIITRGSTPPEYIDHRGMHIGITNKQPPVVCVNHVGAGDCFAAHMLLAMAHKIPTLSAAMIAHCAGRVYVQHPLHRPPWPHEIRRDFDTASGKILASEQLESVRASVSGKIVVAPGIFRMLHAGHCWMLDWAKKQGDCLVVAVNDDVSAWRQKPGEPCLPLAERMAMLAALESVDYVVPFHDDDPIKALMELKPDVMVKGHDYKNEPVVGASMVEVRIAPEGPFGRHVSEIVKEMVK